MTTPRKQVKEMQNLRRTSGHRQWSPTFGICFDVDGVLARGTIPLHQAKRAMKELQDETTGEMLYPVVYVTNSLNTRKDKAQQLSSWFDIPVQENQMVQAQGPLEVFKQYHNKHCLFVGQGKIEQIARELGFKNICSLKQITEAYPLLDMVDHDNRRRIAREGYVNKDFPRVEAIVLLGEPKRWESYLQILVDLLKTDGKPTSCPDAVPENHLPVIACNMDLQFSERACMPRYGHGAFLLCLEALYKKVTGCELKYTSLVGKPSEITYRFAEHCLTREWKRLGHDQPIKRMYLIGDTVEVDIVGSNLYQRYIQRLIARRSNVISDSTTEDKDTEFYDPELPESRNIPRGSILHKQTVEQSDAILVCTGVYKPGQGEDEEGEKNYRGHRDFPFQSELYRPHCTLQDVEEAIAFILQRETAEE